MSMKYIHIYQQQVLIVFSTIIVDFPQHFKSVLILTLPCMKILKKWKYSDPKLS